MTWKRPWMGATIMVAGVIASAMMFGPATRAQNATQDDVEQTQDGPITIRPLVHASVLLQFREKNYYIDPALTYDWASLPKADLILVTHEHQDHLSPTVIAQIRKESTQIIANEASAAKLPGAIVMRNGDRREILDVTVGAVPAYNVVRTQYHPKGRDNGYVITFADRRVYLAGDTEATSEMKALEKIDIAFLPINLPFTMTPQDAADAARAFKPRILYPYHQGSSDPNVVKSTLADLKEVEVRVRQLP
jgi:L-ascorbate metabolism protein UlaG (beta-lactamase superfamily)